MNDLYFEPWLTIMNGIDASEEILQQQPLAKEKHHTASTKQELPSFLCQD
jgi:hypothetical protein